MVMVAAMIVNTPQYSPDPDPPTPHITRPTIKAFMFGAAPQRAEPTSKMTTLKM